MFKDYLASSKQHIEQWLGEVLTSPNREFKPLYESMNYSLMQGGKRIRPILSKAVLEMLHKDPWLVNHHVLRNMYGYTP